MSEGLRRSSFNRRSNTSSLDLRNSLTVPSNSIAKIADIPIQCPHNYTVLEASKLMNQSRNHCLIVNDEITNKLVGLITARDLAYRIVADGCDPETHVSEIMTKRPYFDSVKTSATDALRLMVTRKIRHLPLIDESEVVVGILNITKCFYHAMIRLEKMSLESQKLQMTFNDLRETQPNELEFSKYNIVKSPDETTESLSGGNGGSGGGALDFSILERKRKIVDELKNLIDIMKQPNLKIILEDPDLNIVSPIVIDSKTSILNAAKLLRQHNTTAALVCDSTSFAKQTEHIIGILTSKDIAFRALANGINAESTAVARIMTPKPSFADETLSIHTALRIMYEGKFLNLPVKAASGEVTGLVSVLQLTYALLKTLDGAKLQPWLARGRSSDALNVFDNTNDDQCSYNTESGPAWDRFWESLDQPLTAIDSSERSRRGSHNHHNRHPYFQQHNHNISTSAQNSQQYLNHHHTPKQSSLLSRNLHSTTRYSSTIDDTVNQLLANAPTQPTTTTHESFEKLPSVHSNLSSTPEFTNEIVPPTPTAANIESFIKISDSRPLSGGGTLSSSIDVIFKLKIIENVGLNLNGKIHKLKVNLSTFGKLVEIKKKISGKIKINLNDCVYDLSYIDEDEDLIAIDRDEDLETALEGNANITLVLDIKSKSLLKKKKKKKVISPESCSILFLIVDFIEEFPVETVLFIGAVTLGLGLVYSRRLK